MKRLVAILLISAIIFSNLFFIYAERNDGVVEKVANFLQKEKILVGNNDGDLLLENTLTRQDAVILLARLLGSEEEAKHFPTDKLKFTDIKNNYYKPFLAWALENGYFLGYSDIRFGFGDEITVQQYTTVLLRTLGYDIDYKAAIEKGEELGLLKGIEDKEEISLIPVPRNIVAIMTVNTLNAPMNPEMTDGNIIKLGTKLKINIPKELIKEISEARLLANPASIPPKPPTKPVTPPISPIEPNIPPVIPPTYPPTPPPKPTTPEAIAEFIPKIDLEGLVPFGIAKIRINDLLGADTYELEYKLSDGKIHTTERTKISSKDSPLFRYTEYVNIRVYDIKGELLKSFTDIKLSIYQ